MADIEKYKPSHIANYFLKKAIEDNIEITQLKLLKLVYIGYGWIQAVLERAIFDEPIEAWQHGPVVPSLYNEFKHFGKSPIDTFATEFDLETEVFLPVEIPQKEDSVYLVLGKVWDVYHRFSAWALRDKTHEENTPWTSTFDNSNGAHKRIEPELIKEHFQKKIAKYIDAAK